MTPNLVDQLLSDSTYALAQVISQVENESAQAPELLDALHPFIGKAYRLGITGPPGAGKSTLVDKLASLYRRTGRKVGIIGVDPSSPFTGGALLGDRLRMSEHYLDDGIFIRSMATRGETGGLAARTQEVGDVLDAAGFEILIFETVGVGQVELDVVEAVDTTVVVLVPESGDDVQLMKAGIFEIADIFVVNKSDREGAGQLRLILEQLLSMKDDHNAWQPPVHLTSATQDEGIGDLFQALEDHHMHLTETGNHAMKRRERARRRVEHLIARDVMSDFWTINRREALEIGLEKTPPYQLAHSIRSMT